MLILAKRKVEAAYAERGMTPDNVKIASIDIERLGNAFTLPTGWTASISTSAIRGAKNAGSNKHHLTHPRQLLQYRQLMDEGAEIWFKTDDDDLFRDSLQYFPAAGLRSPGRPLTCTPTGRIGTCAPNTRVCLPRWASPSRR